MGIFEHFPYTNFHDLNLDWIIQELEKLSADVQDFISINAIKYANYHETNYTEEKSKLYLKKNYSYTLDSNQGTALIKKREEKNIDEMRIDEKRLDEIRLEENRIDKINDTYKDTDIVLDNDNELF